MNTSKWVNQFEGDMEASAVHGEVMLHDQVARPLKQDEKL